MQPAESNAKAHLGAEITVVICEDNEIVRTGLTYILQDAGGFKIVGTAHDGLTAVHLVLETHPDVVLMDIKMPRMDGIEATSQIKLARPKTKILMVAGSSEEQTIFAALASGADGYCLKQGPPGNILQAIVATATGACWLDPAIAMLVLRHCVHNGFTSSQNIPKRGCRDDRFHLSVREMEVLHFLVEGYSNREIAGRLILSAETVKTHISHILEKLAVSDRTQAAVKALRTGLVKNGTDASDEQPHGS